MPELVEVEVMSRNLRRWLEGQEVRLEVLDPALGLAGRRGRVLEVGRRAKYALLRTERETWVLHFRMTGEVVKGPAPRFVRARFHGEQGCVDFVDPRRFGTIAALEDPSPLFAELGEEPWPERRDAAWWEARLGGLKTPLKPALMQQARVAGLGNIAAAEICFRAGLDPAAPASATDWEALAEAAWSWLEEAVAATEADRIEWAREGHSSPVFAVYGREGLPCPRCGAPIQRWSQSGRSTYACPRCQRRGTPVK